MLLLASITDRLVEVATNVVGDLGLAGVFVLMLLESACIPIPSEATMMFSGFNVSDAAPHRHSYTLVELVAVGSVANLVGSWVAYAVGYFGRVDLIEKHGRKLHIKPSHLATADRWFQRHGDATVFFTRMLPIVRTFISLPAGVAKMPFWRFSAFTLAGCVPWVLLPVSSSGHLVLVPALLGWRYGELDAELRKSFEVALHAGTALALLIGLRREVADVLRELDGRRLARHVLEMLPAAGAALAFER